MSSAKHAGATQGRSQDSLLSTRHRSPQEQEAEAMITKTGPQQIGKRCGEMKGLIILTQWFSLVR